MRPCLLLLCLIVCCGCHPMEPPIHGSGTIKSEAREIGDFRRLGFGGAGKLVITAGAEQVSCTVRCDDNLLQYVTTEVVKDELRINLTRNIAPTEKLQFEISVPQLSHMQLAGSTSTDVRGLSQDTFDVTLAGSHELTCEGEANAVSLHGAGSCKVLGENLKTKSTTIKLAGSATANIDVSDELTIDIAGTGTVRYRGNPKIKQSIAGSGKVEKLTP